MPIDKLRLPCRDCALPLPSCRFNLPLPDLADIELCYLYRWLKRQWRSGELGHGIGRVDAVLPNGRLLSGASAYETLASARVLRPRRLNGKRNLREYWGVD